jgi:glycosyltransferase involved in cell wall biosynthesis
MKISGYTTTRNAKQMDYPFEATIRSLLEFCDEVIVADSSDQNDGTLEVLEALMSEDERVSVIQVEVPWNAPNYGIYDGIMKAKAREACSGDYLFQIDCDEVVEDNPRQKIEDVIKKMGDAPLLALPVVEYWGSKNKIRVDVNPWKWRLSKNDSRITHGIPSHLRWQKDGLLFARHGTDGCDYIFRDTGNIVPCMHFINNDIEKIRQAALTDAKAADIYRVWFQSVIEQLPTVYHFSWWNIASKIRKYRHFWNDSWLTLYGEKDSRPTGWNPFFSIPLSEVSEEQIERYAKMLAAETGGHIFHVPWTGQKINHITLEHTLPKCILNWAKEHEAT